MRFLNALTVWRNAEVKRRLGWYYNVMTDARPAKFTICMKLHVDYDAEDDEAELWKKHDRAGPAFRDLHSKIRRGRVNHAKIPIPEKNLLGLKAEILRRMLGHCHLCERRCGANRLRGEKGFCKLDYRARVSTSFRHFGEEPPLVGDGGSGTIFFTSCSFSCVACQNHDISRSPEAGAIVDALALSKIMRTLRAQGALNINVVGGEPTMHSPTIIESLRQLDVNVPFLWNSNMYCSTELMKVLAEIVDIWLSDYKYGNDECAKRISNVSNYLSVVTRNHMIASQNGDMIIRHLVLPNHVDCCTRPVLEWIAENIGDRVLVNVMRQYRPENLVAMYPSRYPEIARRLTDGEVERAYGYARDLGLIFEPVS